MDRTLENAVIDFPVFQCHNVFSAENQLRRPFELKAYQDNSPKFSL